ncbi:MAG: hypothetical protein M1839_004023 [Geoglossum umbratile]|nr:MAG: hypothetical protein M1839_004023 [Geoglossum umbratile]
MAVSTADVQVRTTKSRSAWKYRKEVSITANFEDYRRFIKQEVEKIRSRMLELEVWKTERLRKEANEAQRRQYQIDRLETPPRSEERGPPAMPVPFNDLYAEPSDGLGHFIFTNAPDQYQELKIKSLCVQARIALTARSSKEAEALANTACKLASEFDFEPIFAKAQFWRGAAAYQMGLWPTAIEAFKVGQKAKGIYLEGAVSEIFLERAEMTLAQRREEAARMARVARVITVTDSPASIAEENSPDGNDSLLPPSSLAAELEGLSPDSSERSESVKSDDMDSSAGESDNDEPFAYESY